MKFEMKPTTQRAGIVGGIIGAALQLLSFLISLIPLVACLISPITILGSLLLPLGVGAYSIMLARKAGGPSADVGQDAVDGGIAGAIGAVISGLVAIIVGILRAVLSIST